MTTQLRLEIDAGLVWLHVDGEIFKAGTVASPDIPESLQGEWERVLEVYRSNKRHAREYAAQQVGAL